MKVAEIGDTKFEPRETADLKRPMAEAKGASSAVQVKPASLEDCQRLGIAVAWFKANPHGNSSNIALARINSVRLTLNARCRALLGEIPLKVDVGKQAKGFVVLRFSAQGEIPVDDRKGVYNIRSRGLVSWLEEQGVSIGAYPVEWDAERKCLYLRLADVIAKAPKVRQE